AAIQSHKNARRELEKRNFSVYTCRMMGMSLFYKLNGMKSLPDARRWLEMGVKKGDVLARNALVMMYLQGIGGPTEIKKGMELLQKGASDGDLGCIAMLARCSFLGSYGLGPDTEKGRELAEKVIQAGNPLVVQGVNFGPFSIFGLCAFFGMDKNVAEADRRRVAEEHFRAGVQMADGFACTWTHWTTTHPIPEEVTELEAVMTLIRKSATEEKNASAQCLLGFAYDFGWGVEEDATEALKWFTLAAEQGFATAEVALYQAYSTGRGVEMNEDTARKWLQAATGKAQPQAQSLWRMVRSRIGDFGLEK
ncbi:MAG: tetratricopeptide repeat protein, partial [Planctomycetia bacterium]|nr:tetratricopeptide repeat protein [Planctomycetia bacterium]